LITLDGFDWWSYESLNPSAVIETCAEAPDLSCREGIDQLCVLEHAVFERPNLFKSSYPYTINVVRNGERARRLAEVWCRATSALLCLFQPRAVFIWNGRYLPYRAVSAACDAVGQLFFTSEIGWIPGTIFLDRGALSATTTDLFGRDAEAMTAPPDLARADRFLADYTTHKATMVSQAMAPVAEVRQRLLGESGTFLLLYGCQVDWDTNVVIGARRFRSNAAAVSFLLECIDAIPGARMVVKTHPLDSEKNEDALRGILGRRGSVVSDIHPHALIEAADAVAVRNSTLGFEALCYGKPLVVLEDAKYKQPGLTLDARDVVEGAANLVSVSDKTCTLPDRVILRRFILHLLDHYLLPVRYRYFFEPEKLDLLSHFTHSQSYRGLEQLLSRVPPPTLTLADADDSVFRALQACELCRSPQQSFLQRQVRRFSDWLSRGPSQNARSA
jgi:hypothetical protein